MGLIGLVMEILVLASAIAAVVTNALLVNSCSVLELQSGGTTFGSIGFFRFNNPMDEDDDECVEISDIFDREIKDRAFNCARVCAIMSFGFGAILLVYGFWKQCSCFRQLPCHNFVMDLSSTGVQICLALVYVVWLSEACDIYDCTRSTGLDFLICTQVLWFFVGCFGRCMRKGRKERNDNSKQ